MTGDLGDESSGMANNEDRIVVCILNVTKMSNSFAVMRYSINSNDRTFFLVKHLKWPGFLNARYSTNIFL